MSLNRVQKLLFSAYSDFEDMVLVESPFAQTTKQGIGIRQVHLGLTPTKLVIATDVLPPADNTQFGFVTGIDPEIETFELIAIYPIECINLSVYQRRKRQALKARFCNNRVYYFELGGFQKRNMFWNLWCERVKFLAPDEYSGSCRSETSAASSTTTSTIRLINSKLVMHNRIGQVWCTFDKSESYDLLKSGNKWTERNLYLGRNLEDWPLNYKPCMQAPQTIEGPNDTNHKSSVKINRFGRGVQEGCKSELLLPVGDYFRRKNSSEQVPPPFGGGTIPIYYVEDVVKMWEKPDAKIVPTVKHKRRYAFCPKPLLIHGLDSKVPLGTNRLSAHKRISKAISMTDFHTKNTVKLSVPKTTLLTSISLENLFIYEEDVCVKIHLLPCHYLKRKPIYFWTTNHWYRPQLGNFAYKQTQKYLNRFRDSRQSVPLPKPHKSKFRKPKNHHSNTSNSDSEQNFDSVDVGCFNIDSKRKSAKTDALNRPSPANCSDVKRRESHLQYVRRVTRLDRPLNVTDFRSATILTEQLTLIDRDLFLAISPAELVVFYCQKPFRNVPNISAILSFQYRICCLVATEIITRQNDRIAACKLCVKFINVAQKCYAIGNWQSCRSVLYGLQCPAVYRLDAIWTLVRQKYRTKYRIFEYLCHLQRDPRLIMYQKSFKKIAKNSACLPFIGYVITRLFNNVIPVKINQSKGRKSSDEKPSVSTTESLGHNQKGHINVFQLVLMKLWNFWSFKPFRRSKLDEESVKETNDLIVNTKVSQNTSISTWDSERIKSNRNCIKSLLKTIDFVRNCQMKCLKYSFQQDYLIREYLLKARYRDDFWNFFYATE